MFDSQKWAELLTGVSCPMCKKVDNERKVLNMPSGKLLLTDDGDFKGYCILEYHRHATELFELSPEENIQLIHDICAAAEAIQSVCSPSKINYVILGNEVPHLHCHIIPRYPEDGWWGKPTWLRPDTARNALSLQEYSSLKSRLREALMTSQEKTKTQ
jgi:diadenosine tetraphosphate (Ap4A) HIT family hydrolase